jgi:PBP4 family serine-type D-alanyl-D-alanine carboxypeptidase
MVSSTLSITFHEDFMVKSILHVAGLAALLAASGFAQQPASLQERVAEIMRRPEYVHARFGMEFWSLDDNQAVFRINEQQLFTPGSTTKLLTEGTALSLLGPDFRFHTRIYRTGAVDAAGVLQGDLVLVASGDPNLSNRIQPDGSMAFENVDHSYDSIPGSRVVPGDPLAVLRALARRVAAAGIKHVAGRVRVDASLFPEGTRELGTGVTMSPIVVNDNVIDLIITPGAEGAAAELKVSPDTPYVRANNEIKTGAADSRVALRTHDVRAEDGSHTLTWSGSIPAGAAVLRVYRVPEPSRFAEMALAQALKDAGVAVEGAAVAAKALSSTFYKPENLVAEHVSPPFTEEVKVTLKVSQNLHASNTPYVLGSILGQKNGPDTLQAGFDLENQFLRKAGLDLSGASQSDGAGGAAFYTPDFMVHYLTYMSRQDALFPAFFRALPILGKDGTLWDIQPNSPAAGRVHAKTGTFSASDLLNRSLMVTGKGIAGFIDRKDGRRLAFAAYINMVSGDPDTIAHHVGDALGEIAAAAWDGTLP